MPELVQVSNVSTWDELQSYLRRLFDEHKYAEITQAIGIYSVLLDAPHTLRDQAALYRFILSMLKDRIHARLGHNYGAWYTGFPAAIGRLVTSDRLVCDAATAETIASRQAAFGPFASLDDFFFWALEDRRLSISQIMQYVSATTGAAA